MTKKISVNNLIIEITRKCNMNCEHCLRGNSQNIDVNFEHVEKLFSQIDYISTLSFGGGEPSLVPEKILKIIEIAKKYNIGIDSFYIATNAKQVTKEFMYAIFELYSYCSENEVSQVEISNDDFHNMNLNDDEIKIRDQNIEKLKIFSLVGERGDIEESNLIPQGKALDNFYCKRTHRIFAPEIDFNDEKDYYSYNETLYLNCKGNLLSDCDLSYETQDCETLIISNVTNDNFNLKEDIKKYVDRMDSLESNDVLNIVEEC